MTEREDSSRKKDNILVKAVVRLVSQENNVILISMEDN